MSTLFLRGAALGLAALLVGAGVDARANSVGVGGAVHVGGGHHHHHHGHAHTDVVPETVGTWGLILLGMSGGIIPCQPSPDSRFFRW